MGLNIRERFPKEELQKRFIRETFELCTEQETEAFLVAFIQTSGDQVLLKLTSNQVFGSLRNLRIDWRHRVVGPPDTNTKDLCTRLPRGGKCKPLLIARLIEAGLAPGDWVPPEKPMDQAEADLFKEEPMGELPPREALKAIRGLCDRALGGEP